MARKLFKSTVAETVDIKAGQKNVNIEWPFEDLKPHELATYKDSSGNDKLAIAFGCGCTGTPELLSDRLCVKYNDSGNNKGLVSKALTVFYKDSEDTPVRVRNEKGVEIFNPNLGKTVLTFSVNIKD